MPYPLSIETGAGTNQGQGDFVIEFYVENASKAMHSGR